jgi:hypothetical protein
MLQRRLSATTIVLLFAVRIALGQAGTADLTGIISDSSGGLLNAAKVTATDTETRVSTETHTGAGGVYVVTNLRPSVYEVSAQTDGLSDVGSNWSHSGDQGKDARQLNSCSWERQGKCHRFRRRSVIADRVWEHHPIDRQREDCRTAVERPELHSIGDAIAWRDPSSRYTATQNQWWSAPDN